MKQRELWLLCVPIIVWVAIFCYYPMYGLLMAFVDYVPGREIWQCDFVGLKYFARFVTGNDFPRLLRNTLAMSGLSLTVGFVCPILFAFMLNELGNLKIKKFVQTASYLPHFISWVIMFSLMSSLFGSSGLVNSLMSKFGAEMTVNILTTDKHVWLIQALLYTWKNLGWNAIIYFAAITGLDQEVNEAAMIDGASRWQRILHITIPLLMPTFFVLLIMSIGNFLNSGIDQYLAFCNALNKEHIEVLDLYVYNLGIGSGQISFSVAVGVMKSVIALILFTFANTASKKIRGTSVF